MSCISSVVIGFSKRNWGLQWRYRETAVHAAADQIIIIIWGGGWESIVSVTILQSNVTLLSETHFALHEAWYIAVIKGLKAFMEDSFRLVLEKGIQFLLWCTDGRQIKGKTNIKNLSDVLVWCSYALDGNLYICYVFSLQLFLQFFLWSCPLHVYPPTLSWSKVCKIVAMAEEDYTKMWQLVDKWYWWSQYPEASHGCRMYLCVSSHVFDNLFVCVCVIHKYIWGPCVAQALRCLWNTQDPTGDPGCMSYPVFLIFFFLLSRSPKWINIPPKYYKTLYKKTLTHVEDW